MEVRIDFCFSFLFEERKQEYEDLKQKFNEII